MASGTTKDDIICWKRPRRKLGLESLESLSSAHIVSPKNVTSSSISAITFDESQFMNSSLNPQDDANKSENIINQECEVTPQIEQEAARKTEEQYCSKGSLYCRITNNGYNEIQGCNKEAMTTCQDEENPDSDHSHVEQVCHSEIDVEETVEDDDDENLLLTQQSCSTPTQQSHSFILEEVEERDEDSECTLIQDEPVETSEINSKSTDEWREVKDGHTGTSYFYNRRTRESTWHLPPNAILLAKSRNIKKVKPRMNPREVSMTSSEMTTTTTDYSSFLLHNDDDFTDCVESTNNSVDNENNCDDDVTSCIDEAITDDSEILIERCKRLKKPFQVGQRRKFFFPEQLNEQNNRDEGKDDKNQHQTKPLIERNEESSGSAKLFCMFCAHEVSSTTEMVLHLRNDCSSTLKIPRDQMLEISNAMDCILCRTISNDSNWDVCKTKKDTIPLECDKENIPPKPLHSREQTEDVDQLEESVIFTNSDEEATVTDFDLTLRSKGKSPIMKNSLKYTIGDDKYEYECESPIMTRCPFCCRSFPIGSNLSKHLLACNARRWGSNKKRIRARKRRETFSIC